MSRNSTVIWAYVGDWLRALVLACAAITAWGVISHVDKLPW